MEKHIFKNTSDGTLKITVKAEKYFSITGYLKYNDGGYACGRIHEEILSVAPQLKFLIAMHLSDCATGMPMHAFENGWHWLANAAIIKQPWEPDQSPEECLVLFAKHCRITLDEAKKIVYRIGSLEKIKGIDAAKDEWREIKNDMLPIWHRQASRALILIGKMK